MDIILTLVWVGIMLTPTAIIAVTIGNRGV
jgi:hypothetical protein